ncbi:MAG: MarR family winged helix-turn-helix transcriptional regulator [Hyphomicrobiales bacterium]|nr:MarR family winged helix-turn-helix transcriptional regulator [Hyphomicrobiales bacterium]
MSDLHCTCYRLRKAARRITQIYDQHLAETGLTANQHGMLTELARSGALSMGRLSALIGMDASTLTRNLRPLARRGLIEVATARDRRAREVRLTKTGAERLAAALKPWRAAEGAVMRALGQRDAALLNDLLARVASEAPAADRPSRTERPRTSGPSTGRGRSARAPDGPAKRPPAAA